MKQIMDDFIKWTLAQNVSLKYEKTGAAYIRVSTDKQDELSPISQLKEIWKDFNKKSIYLDPQFIFIEDKGISGRKSDNRPEFQRMISIAKSKPKPFDVLGLWKFSRFARNEEESIVYKSLLRKDCGIEVISVSEPLVDGIFGSLIERIIEWFDAFYSINLSGEVIRGMTEKAERGEAQTRPPYGWIIKDGKFIQDKTKSKIVKKIYTDHCDNIPIRQIAKNLNDLGIKTNTGNSWTPYAIRYVIKNKLNKGDMIWKGIESKDIVKPIVDEETFNNSNKKLINNLEKYKNIRNTNPINHWLKNLVYCSNCGSKLVKSGYSRGKIKKRLMQCSGYNHNKCYESHSILIERLEKAVLRDLRDVYANKGVDIQFVKKKPETTDNNIIIEDNIKKTTNSLERAKRLYLEGIDTIEEYKENKNKYTKILDELKKELSLTTKKTDNIKEIKIKAKTIYDALNKENISMDIKYDMAHSLIDKIVYNKNKNEIEIFYKNNPLPPE